MGSCELSPNLSSVTECCIIDSVFSSAEFFTVRRPLGIRAMSGSPAISGSSAVAAKEKEGIPKGNLGAKDIITTDPPRGTRDFPPEDMRMRTWLFDNFREVEIFHLVP